MSSTPELLDTTSEFLSLQLGERQRPLFEVPAIVAEFFPGGWDGKDVRDSAMRRAEALADSLGNTAEAERVAAIAYAGELIAALAIERTWEPPEIDRIVAATADAVDTPAAEVRLALYREALADPRLLGLPPSLAIQTTLRLLVAFAGLDAASFWVVNPARAVRCVVALGSGTRRMRNAAEEAVRHDGQTAFQGRGHGCARQALASRRRRRRRPAAGGAGRDLRGGGGPCARARARARVPARPGNCAGAFARGGERTPPRTARLRPPRRPAAGHRRGAPRAVLAARRARAAARPGRRGRHPSRRSSTASRRAVSRSEIRLRELSQSAESPAILARPFRALLEAEITSFVAASDVEADVDLRGDLDSLTASQRIALLRIVQEALSNAREHSGADRVRISIVRVERQRPRRDRGRRQRLRARAHAGARRQARPHGPRRHERARAPAGRRIRRSQRRRRPDAHLRDPARMAPARRGIRPDVRRARALDVARPPPPWRNNDESPARRRPPAHARRDPLRARGRGGHRGRGRRDRRQPGAAADRPDEPRRRAARHPHAAARRPDVPRPDLRSATRS